MKQANRYKYAFKPSYPKRIDASQSTEGLKTDRIVRKSPGPIRSPSSFKLPKTEFLGTRALLKAILPHLTNNNNKNITHVAANSVSGAVVILPRASEQIQRIRSNTTHPVDFLAKGAAPQANDGLVLKFFKYEKPPASIKSYMIPYNTNEEEFVNEVNGIVWEASREFDIMKKLNAARPVTIGNKKFDVRQYVPKPFFLAYWPTLRVFAIGMSLSPGKTFNNVHREGVDLGASILVTIEKAFLAMWFQGVIHTDLHGGNLLLNPLTGQVSIIDFGRAMRLMPKVTATLRAEFANAVKERRINATAMNPIPPKMTKIIINTSVQHSAVSNKRPYIFWGNTDMLKYFVSYGCKVPQCNAAQLAAHRVGPDGWIPQFREKRKLVTAV